jgi:hypothetical protein
MVWGWQNISTARGDYEASTVQDHGNRDSCGVDALQSCGPSICWNCVQQLLILHGRGYGYRNRAIIRTSTYGASAETYIGSYPEVTRPAGWYGALARLYNDSGVLVLQDGYTYSSVPCLGIGISTATYSAVHDNYKSYGVSKSWNGSSYIGHATWSSPYQTF